MGHKMATVIECPTAHKGDPVQVADFSQTLALAKGAVTNVCHLTRTQVHLLQCIAVVESAVAHFGHRSRNENRVQALAIGQRAGTYLHKLRRQGYRLHRLVACQLPRGYFGNRCEILQFVERGDGLAVVQSSGKSTISEANTQTGYGCRLAIGDFAIAVGVETALHAQRPHGIALKVDFARLVRLDVAEILPSSHQFVGIERRFREKCLRTRVGDHAERVGQSRWGHRGKASHDAQWR